MALYSKTAVDNLIQKYDNKTGGNFDIYTIPGSLLDNYIIIAGGYKTAIIKEVYINCWTSAYKITMYNKIPAKYAKVIEALENEADGFASDLFFK